MQDSQLLILILFSHEELSNFLTFSFQKYGDF